VCEGIDFAFISTIYTNILVYLTAYITEYTEKWGHKTHNHKRRRRRSLSTLPVTTWKSYMTKVIEQHFNLKVAKKDGELARETNLNFM